jgi:hypothetical protein
MSTPGSGKNKKGGNTMTEHEKWFIEKRVERTIKALKKNNFDARYAANSAESLGEIFQMIPEGSTVGVGGSLTLGQIGFFEEVKKRPVTLLNPSIPGLSPEEALKVRREILLADVFLSSSNAVTEDGALYNIDATGNRVAAMMFGPRKVILVCGVNKVVRDIAEAEARVRDWASPMNARRLSVKTPCVDTGECADCASPQRICNIYVAMKKKPLRTDVTVLLVGEALGF